MTLMYYNLSSVCLKAESIWFILQPDGVGKERRNELGWYIYHSITEIAKNSIVKRSSPFPEGRSQGANLRTRLDLRNWPLQQGWCGGEHSGRPHGFEEPIRINLQTEDCTERSARSRNQL